MTVGSHLEEKAATSFENHMQTGYITQREVSQCFVLLHFEILTENKPTGLLVHWTKVKGGRSMLNSREM